MTDLTINCWAVRSRYRAERLVRDVQPLIDRWPASYGLVELPCPTSAGVWHVFFVIASEVGRLPPLEELPSIMNVIHSSGAERVAVTPEIAHRVTIQFHQQEDRA